MLLRSNTKSNVKNKMTYPRMHQKMETGKYHLGSARHAAEFEEITQMVINIIKKDFEYAKDLFTVDMNTNELVRILWIF